MRIIPHIIILCIVLKLLGVGLFVPNLSAQNINKQPLNVQNFQIQNGLPSNNINFTFQDYKGFIWIGTYTSLCKYDGYRFTNYYPDLNSENTINVGNYFSYVKLNDSIYYLSTKLDGIIKLNVDNNTLKRVSNSPPSVVRMCLDKQGGLWIGTFSEGIYYNKIGTNKFEKINAKLSNSDGGINWKGNPINSIAQDPEDNNLLWLGCRFGLYSFNKSNNLLEHYKIKDNNSNHELGYNIINSICFDTEGNLWAGKWGTGLGKFNRITKEWQHFLVHPEGMKQKILNSNIINEVVQIGPNLLSVCGSDGYTEFNTQTNTFTVFLLDIHSERPSLSAVNQFLDKDGNQWFSQINQKGLSMASKRFNSINKVAFPKQQSLPDYWGSVALDAAYSRKNDRYYLTISNHDGIISYNKDFTDSKVIPFEYRDGIKEYSAYTLAEDNLGKIWVNSTDGNELWNTDVGNNKLIEFKSKDFKNCFKIIRSNSNKVYFHTEKGIYSLLDNNWKWELANTKVDLVSNIHNSICYYIVGLKLYSVNFESKQNPEILTLPEFATKNFNYIQAIYCDSKGRLWITLEFGGVYQYNLNTKKLKLWSYKEGLINNSTREICEDKNGQIFLLCNGGLYYLNEKQNRFIDFDNLTDRKTNDWYEHTLIFTEDGRIIVSKENAIYLIDKNTVLKKVQKQPIISCFFGENYKFWNGFNEIIVPNNQNDVNIEFTNFDFPSTNETVYEYQLEGFSNKWITLEKGINKVSFVNLPEGNYTFKLRLIGETNVVTCTFKITSVWFKSKLFFILLGLLILLGAGFGLYFYNKRKLQRQKMEKRIAEMRLQILQTQLNPHFLFNCLNSIGALIKIGEYDRAENTLRDFSKLMRTILTVSDKQLIPLSQELELSSLYLSIEKLRKDNLFDIEIINQTTDGILVPPMMLQPFLENCVKHAFKSVSETKKGKVRITCKTDGKDTLISIWDNGLGIAEGKSENPLSKGLQIQRERFMQYELTNNLKMYFTLENGINEGFEVKIVIKR